MKRCTKCILPETTPNIEFDAHGVCNFCRDHQPLTTPKDRSLEALLEQYPGEGDYDCILGLSGGRDSSYALYLLTQVYKKRVLAIHYKSPLSHEQGTKNAIKMAENFDTKLMIITDKNDLHRKTFRNNLVAYLKKPRIAMLSMMCVACKVKWKEIYAIAKQHKVRLILAASNPYEATDFKLGFQGVKPHDKHVYARRFFTALKEVVKNPRYLNKDTLMTTILAFVFIDTKSPASRILYPRQKKADVFYYTDWDEKTVIDTITRYGWEKPATEKGNWRFDCVVGKIKDYIYYSNYGFTEKDDLYSKLIRDHKMSREEAMRRINNENLVDADCVRHCLGVCGLNMADISHA